MKGILFGISLMVFAIWLSNSNLGVGGSGIGMICALLGLLCAVASYFSDFEKKK